MKNLKRIISLILVFAFALSAAMLLASCGGGDTECTEHKDEDANNICDKCGETLEIVPTGEEYTVTVKGADGEKVAGVKLKISTRGKESEELTTDANGIASARLEKVAYVRATVTEVPTGYLKPTAYVEFADNATALTVTLEKDNRVAHTVTLVDNEGNAISGVLVQICQTLCQTPVLTDEEGKAVITFAPEAGYLKVKVTDMSQIPGYEMTGKVDAEGYLHFDEGTTEMQIVVAPID